MPVVSSTVPAGMGAGPLPVGTPWGASLDLSFMTPGTIDPRITFTRASTATYFNSAGTLQTAAVNAPRWDYDPVTHALRGLLLEEARTNVLSQSGDVNNAAWSKFGGSGGTTPVTTANQSVAPDGTTTAASIVYAATSGGQFAVVFQQPTIAAVPYAFSCWLKGNSGGEQLYISADNGAGGYYSSPRLTLTTQWQRFSLVMPALTAGSAWLFKIGTDLRDSGQAATPAQTIFAWGGQLEAGAFPTSYIPTTGAAVTRAADACAMTGTNFSSWFTTNAAGSFAAEVFYSFIAPGTTGTGRLIELSDGTTANFLSVLPSFNTNQYNLASTIASVAGTSLLASSGATPASVVVKVATAYGGGSRFFCANAGGGAGPSPVVSTPGGIATVNQLGIGNRPDLTRALAGYMRRIRYWPRILTNAEMQSVTT